MDIQKNPWKKGSLRPLSSKQKDDQKSKESSNKEQNNGLLGMEITGTKISKQSEKGFAKFMQNKMNRSQQSNRQDDQESEIEEEKHNNEPQIYQNQQLNETGYSETSNIYIDDQLDDLEQNKPRGNFNDYMREKIENNPDKKKVYDNFLLDQKRKEHEDELKKQTSKPFQFQKGRMSSSATAYSKQRSNITTNDGLEGLQNYERSTEFGSKPDTKSEIGDDFLAPSDYLGSRIEQQVSIMGNITDGQNQRNTKIQNKPFKISELKRNSSRTETAEQENKRAQSSQLQQQSSEIKKNRQGLSIKEKKRLQQEEEILKKINSNQQNQIWKINDPQIRQLEQQQKILRDKKKEQVEKIEKSLIDMEKKMTKRNKLKVIALVNGNDNMEDMDFNKPMTEYDIELAEKEGQMHELERLERQQKMQELNEQNVDDLTNMSASEMRNRRLFITDCLKNKSSMQQSFYSQMSQQANENLQAGFNEFNEFNQEEESKELEDMDEESSIHEVSNGNNQHIINRNILNAFKTQKQQAEYGIENFLNPEVRERLSQLLSGCEDFDLKKEEEKLIEQGNPFGLTEEQQKELKNIQKNLEKIKMDDNTIQQILGHELFSLKDAILPKDPQLRDQAEIKILKEKMNSVNERLRDLFDVEKRKEAKSKVGSKVEKIKIQNLVQQLIEQNGNAEPTIEIQNLISDFEENQHLLEESKRIISDLQGQDIEKEVGEYNQILLEAIEIQKKYEEMLDLNTQNALMEEQQDIIKSFKDKFDEIYQTQKEIEEKEKKFVQVVKENNLADLLGMQFNEHNDDYEIEDINQVMKDEEQKLQREIEAELQRIQKKYDQFDENLIDQKLQEMYDYDAMITQKLNEINPNLLDDLRESVLKQQEEVEQQRSQVFQRNPYREYELSLNQDQDDLQQQISEEQDENITHSQYYEEQEEDTNNTLKIQLENNFNEEQIQETINILEKRQREKEERERKKQEYFNKMQQVKQHEQIVNELQEKQEIKQVENFQMLQDSLMQQESIETNTNSINQSSKNRDERQFEFEDSLEM
ncbi:hypothetical protein TTHERM_00118690 (macronuclear) [Tetrahymena thermophila SB210]|uniref:Uncharacterized protein n=1 Tax=Tetrahymena thermophila (strain SB210) TaxID=312017 RepID=Q22Z00_TETTS|nr:hypothetical protein TTHERM_00118690 [Tetrahymena thermophila SB210]EAR90521.1 hypothetical protein TTHERM_00118690 [Tetrahymena thermophila SB210]|eukprot:XP_001010766.1 hypothetical protein TTHERM_00118690 [Tetrahymena thermophila SB210]